MQTRSATYNTLMAAENHYFNVRLHITDPSVQNDPGVYYGMDAMFSLSTFAQAWEVEPTIGGVCAATIDFSLLSSGADIPTMARIVPEYQVTDGTTTSEWITKGVFYLDTRKVTKNPNGIHIFTGNGYDGMMMANKVWSSGAINDTDVNVLANICTIMGVTQDARNTALLNKSYNISFPGTDVTCRDILSYIAVMYGGNWIMNDEGQLRFLPLAGGSDTLAIGTNAADLNVSKQRPYYTRLVLNVLDEGGNDGNIIAGSSDTNVMEAYCPLATQVICNTVYNAIKTWHYKPFESNGVWSDPALEIGDKVTINSTTLTCYTREIIFNKGISMNLSAPFDEDMDHEYTFEAPAARRYRNQVAGIQSSITANAQGITLTVQKIEELSGRNLVLNTATAMATTTTGNHYSSYRYFSDYGKAILNGNTTDKITVSFDYEVQSVSGASAWEATTAVYPQINGAKGNAPSKTVTQNETGHYVETFKLTSGQANFTDPDDSRFRVRCRLQNASDGWKVRVTNFMLKYGEVEVGWSPAPEDLNAESIVSMINVSPDTVTIQANKINLTGETIDLTGDMITITSDNFSVTPDGTVTATNGVFVNAMVSGKFQQTVTKTYQASNYSSSDIDRVRDLVMGNVTPTTADYTKYDLNMDGYFTSTDQLGVAQMVNNGTDYTVTVTTKLDPANTAECMKITQSDGTTAGTTNVVLSGTRVTAPLIYTTDKRVKIQNGKIQVFSASNTQNWALCSITPATAEGQSYTAGQIELLSTDDTSGRPGVLIDPEGIHFTSAGSTLNNISYPRNGLRVATLNNNVSEGVDSTNTTKTYTLSAAGVYLMTVSRYANTDTTHDGVWLVVANNSSDPSVNRSHITPITVGSAAPTPSIDQKTVTITTNSTYQRITLTRLS